MASRSLSRPQVSDDNPFSEAQFKTLKYHPSPGRFGDQGKPRPSVDRFSGGTMPSTAMAEPVNDNGTLYGIN